MSMRISTGGEGNFVDSTRSSATKASALESRGSITPTTSFNTDQVNLSSASSLVALAKGASPSDKSAKIASLSAQIAAGTYRPDSSEVGKALVGSYIRSR